MGLTLKMLNNLVFIFCSVGIIYGLEKQRKFLMPIGTIPKNNQLFLGIVFF